MQFETLEGRRLFATGPTGLSAIYFNDPNFGGTTLARTDRAVDFSWSTKSPAPTIDPTNYSVRWTARVKAPTSETYRLYVTSESAVRVWFGSQLVVDGWKSNAAPTIYKGSIALTGNTRYDLQVELAHTTGAASVKFAWQTDTMVKQTVPNRLLTPADATLSAKINHALAFARDQANLTLKKYPTPASAGYPSYTKADGSWTFVVADDWTSGYFGGVLWQLDKQFPSSGLSTKATSWTTPLASQSSQAGDHFSRLWTTFKPLYDKTGDATYRQVLLAAAASKDAQFNATIGAFKTPEIVSNSDNPNANFGLLIDQTMDLQLMFWASDQTGNTSYRDHAIAHFQTVLARMVRSDGSVFQRFFFNGATSAPIGGENFQGYNNASTWSRGQAWAVYSFSTVAALTGRSDFIAAARKVADYYVAHLPSDGVPYWDFNAPLTSKTPRDTSAAAIATRGLLRLADLTGVASYRTAATNTLNSLLSAKYLSEGTTNRGVLQHGALSVPKNRGTDSGLIFGDYYLLEAINAYTNKG